MDAHNTVRYGDSGRLAVSFRQQERPHIQGYTGTVPGFLLVKCPVWVKLRSTHCEQMPSGLLLKAHWPAVQLPASERTSGIGGEGSDRHDPES
jgi:hypothetical protein